MKCVRCHFPSTDPDTGLHRRDNQPKRWLLANKRITPEEEKIYDPNDVEFGAYFSWRRDNEFSEVEVKVGDIVYAKLV